MQKIEKGSDPSTDYWYWITDVYYRCTLLVTLLDCVYVWLLLLLFFFCLPLFTAQIFRGQPLWPKFVVLAAPIFYTFRRACNWVCVWPLCTRKCPFPLHFTQSWGQWPLAYPWHRHCLREMCPLRCWKTEKLTLNGAILVSNYHSNITNKNNSRKRNVSLFLACFV